MGRVQTALESSGAGFTHVNVGRRMWSPAHLRFERWGGDLTVQRIRRARKDGDPWPAGEPPHETPDCYRIKVSGPGGVVREWDVAEALCVYPASKQTEDFPAGGEAVVEAAHLGPDGEPGAWTALSVEISA